MCGRLGGFCAEGGVMVRMTCPTHGEYWGGTHPVPCPKCALNARDHAWIARELGDVPMRIIDGDGVPVESLGRNP